MYCVIQSCFYWCLRKLPSVFVCTGVTLNQFHQTVGREVPDCSWLCPHFLPNRLGQLWQSQEPGTYAFKVLYHILSASPSTSVSYGVPRNCFSSSGLLEVEISRLKPGMVWLLGHFRYYCRLLSSSYCQSLPVDTCDFFSIDARN